MFFIRFMGMSDLKRQGALNELCIKNARGDTAETVSVRNGAAVVKTDNTRIINRRRRARRSIKLIYLSIAAP